MINSGGISFDSSRIPSLEKYRRMACQTFIFNGQCPYGDRCVFLHDPRVARQHPIIAKPTKNVYKGGGHGQGVAKDTFYWPDMNRNDILKNLDCTSTGMNIPTCEQCYNIPSHFADSGYCSVHDNGVYSLWYHFLGFLDVEVKHRGHELSADNQRFLDASNPTNFFMPTKPRLPFLVQLASGVDEANTVVESDLVDTKCREDLIPYSDEFLPPLATSSTGIVTSTVGAANAVGAVGAAEVQGYDADEDGDAYPDLSVFGQDRQSNKVPDVVVRESYASKARARPSATATSITVTTAGTTTRASPFTFSPDTATAYRPARATTTVTASSTSADGGRDAVGGGDSSGLWSMLPVPHLLDKAVLEVHSAAVSDMSDDEVGYADSHAIDDSRVVDSNEDDGYLLWSDWRGLDGTRSPHGSIKAVDGHSRAGSVTSLPSVGSSDLDDDLAKTAAVFNWFEDMETLLVTSEEDTGDERETGERALYPSRGHGRTREGRKGREGTSKALRRTRRMANMSSHT